MNDDQSRIEEKAASGLFFHMYGWQNLVKKDRWFNWTEYALLLGSGAGAVASVATQQALLAAAPLSLLAALGLISRRQLEAQVNQSQSVMVFLNGKVSEQVKDLTEKLDELPTYDHLRTVRQSIVAQNKQDILSLSQVIEHTRKRLSAKIDAKEFPELQMLQASLDKLQDRYTKLSVELKDVRSRCHQLSDMSRLESTETMVAKLETELMQLRVHLDVLGTNAKNTQTGLDDRLKYLTQQVQHLTTEEQQSLLRAEVQQLAKTMADMVSRNEFLRLSNQLTENHADKLILQELHSQASSKTEDLQQRLQSLEQQLDTMTVSILEAVAETVEPLEANLAAANTDQNQWLVDFATPDGQSTSRQSLEQLLIESHERVVLVWPWAEHMALDGALLQKFRQVLERGCRLDIGWCHQRDSHGQPLLRSIDQHWGITGAQQQQLKQSLNQLLQLKQNYESLFSFKVLGTTENFAVGDAQSALIGMQALLTQTSRFPKVNLKLRTTEPQVVQSLIQQFETTTLDEDDTGAYFNRGITHYDMAAYGDAVADFTQVITTRPNAAVYNWRGVVWTDMGDIARALKDFGNALHLDTRFFEARCNRGALRINVRDYQGALSDLETAASLQPDSPLPYFYQGKALQQLGNLPQALVQFGLAIDRQGDLALPYCYRAVAYQQQGNLRKAIADFETAAALLRHSGDAKNLDQVVRKLETLKQGPRLRTAVLA